METFGLTHIGLTKDKNEDRFLLRDLPDGAMLLAVADGLSGEVSGDLAAEITLAHLSDLKPDSQHPKRQLTRSVQKSDRHIRDKVDIDQGLMGMGTTLTGVLLDKGYAHWVHVGDSRLYLLRDDSLRQITKDDNMVQFMLDEGEITAEEAKNHPGRHFLYQFVGCGGCKPETGSFQIQNHDLVVLTTDGLHGEVEPHFLTTILCNSVDIKTKAEDLIQAALKTGGKDNITIVMAQIG